MTRSARVLLAGAAALAFASGTAHASAAAAQTSPQTQVPVAPAEPDWARPDAQMDAFIDDLLARMTLQEKIGQLTLLTSDWESTGPTMREGYKQDIAAGRVGAIFNAYTCLLYTSPSPRD